MRATIKCIATTDQATKELVIHCDMNCLDIVVKNKKYASITCNLPSIMENLSSKDHEKYFEITPDGDYRFLVEFKTNPESLRIYAQHHEGIHGSWDIIISGV